VYPQQKCHNASSAEANLEPGTIAVSSSLSKNISEFPAEVA